MFEGFAAGIPATGSRVGVPGAAERALSCLREAERGVSEPRSQRGAGTRDPDFWFLSRFTGQRVHCLKTNAGKLSCESPRVVIFKSFSDKDRTLN